MLGNTFKEDIVIVVSEMVSELQFFQGAGSIVKSVIIAKSRR